MDGSLRFADGNEPIRAVGEGRARPGQVEAAVECRDDGTAGCPAEGERIPLEVAVDEVEVLLVVEDLERRDEHVAADVAAVTGRPERLGDSRDQPARKVGIA